MGQETTQPLPAKWGESSVGGDEDFAELVCNKLCQSGGDKECERSLMKMRMAVSDTHSQGATALDVYCCCGYWCRLYGRRRSLFIEFLNRLRKSRMSSFFWRIDGFSDNIRGFFG